MLNASHGRTESTITQMHPHKTTVHIDYHFDVNTIRHPQQCICNVAKERPPTQCRSHGMTNTQLGNMCAILPSSKIRQTCYALLTVRCGCKRQNPFICIKSYNNNLRKKCHHIQRYNFFNQSEFITSCLIVCVITNKMTSSTSNPCRV